MSKFMLVGLALCASLILVSADGGGNENTGVKLKDRPGYEYEARERLGHFKHAPFMDLYKLYAINFIFEQSGRDKNDHRNYAPAGDECVTFLRRFRMDKYVLRDVHEFVLLDACLGYFFDNRQEYLERDSSVSDYVKSDIAVWQQTEELKSIWEGTKINEYDNKDKKCVGQLLYDSVRLVKQFKDVTCNHNWLKAFTDFAACQTDLLKHRDEDSYLKIIYELVKRRAYECWMYEIKHLNVAIRTKYLNNPFTHTRNKLSWSRIRKQAGERMWPKEITELLKMVQDPKGDINLREVSNIIRGVHEQEENAILRFTLNVAKYADSHIKRTKEEAAGDPYGMVRFKRLLDKRCMFFRHTDHSNPKYYDFTLPFNRMIKMLTYPEIFGIEKQYFVDTILNKSYETAPLYMSVLSCQMLAYTQGQFEYNRGNSQDTYVVMFVPDTSTMPQWPDAGFY